MGDITNLQIDIGKAIRKGLENHHMIQRDLAETLGKSVSLVSEWTRNVKVPSGDDLIRVAVWLDIVEDLFPGYTKVQGEGKKEEREPDVADLLRELQQQIRKMDERITKLESRKKR